MPLASAGVVFGQESPGARDKGIQDLRGQLEAVRQSSKDLVSGIDTIAAERQRINAQASETAKLIQQSETQLNQIQSKIDQLQTQEKQLRSSLEERHGSITALLAAMQRSGRMPPPVMVTKREDALAMVRSAMLLAAAFPELRGEAVALGEQLQSLLGLMTSIREERDKLQPEQTRLEEARRQLVAQEAIKLADEALRSGSQIEISLRAHLRIPYAPAAKLMVYPRQ